APHGLPCHRGRRQALLDLLRSAWVEPARAERPLDMALQFALLLPKEEILDLLDQRVARLEQVRAELADAREGFESAVPALDAVIEDLFERSERNVSLEL